MKSNHFFKQMASGDFSAWSNNFLPNFVAGWERIMVLRLLLAIGFFGETVSARAQQTGIGFSVVVDSCLDSKKMVAIWR